MAKAYKEAVKWECKRVYRGKPITGPVKVSIWYWFPTKKRRDLLNDKLTWDGLTDIIWEDDSQIVEAHIYKRYNKGKPRTKIIVEELKL